MLKVHHLNRSQSERIVWLCEDAASGVNGAALPVAGGEL